MELSAQIKQLADQLLVSSGHFALDVRVNTRLNPPKLVVVVDGDAGITIADCANLSRTLSDSINKAGLLEDYTLEVTTPGIDQPLKLLRQYQKHIGRTLKVELKDKEIVRGTLQQIEGDEMVIQEVGKEKGKKEKSLRRIAFDQIDKTFVMISLK